MGIPTFQVATVAIDRGGQVIRAGTTSAGSGG